MNHSFLRLARAQFAKRTFASLLLAMSLDSTAARRIQEAIAAVAVALAVSACGGSDGDTKFGLPTTDAGNTAVGPSGGTALSADGNALIAFPAGSVEPNSAVSIEPIDGWSLPDTPNFRGIELVSGTSFHVKFTNGALRNGDGLEISIRLPGDKVQMATQMKRMSVQTLQAQAIPDDAPLVSVVHCPNNTIIIATDQPMDTGYGGIIGFTCESGAQGFDISLGRKIAATPSALAYSSLIGEPGDDSMGESFPGANGKIAFDYWSSDVFNNVVYKRSKHTLALLSDTGEVARLPLSAQASLLDYDGDSRILTLEAVGDVRNPEDSAASCSLVTYLAGFALTGGPFLNKSKPTPVPLSVCAARARGAFTAKGVAVATTTQLLWYEGTNQRARIDYAFPGAAGSRQSPDQISAARTDSQGNLWLAGIIGASNANRCDTRAYIGRCAFVAKFDPGGALLGYHELDGLSLRNSTSRVSFTLDSADIAYISAPVSTGTSGGRVILQRLSAQAEVTWSRFLTESWGVDPSVILVDSRGTVHVATTWGELGRSVSKPNPEPGAFAFRYDSGGANEQVTNFAAAANITETTDPIGFSLDARNRPIVVMPVCGNVGALINHGALGPSGAYGGCADILIGAFEF